MKGNRTMNKSREVGRVDVKKLVDRGMSRCLFGEWPRRALLKLGHSDYEGASSYWQPQEDRAPKNNASASGVGW